MESKIKSFDEVLEDATPEFKGLNLSEQDLLMLRFGYNSGVAEAIKHFLKEENKNHAKA